MDAPDFFSSSPVRDPGRDHDDDPFDARPKTPQTPQTPKTPQPAAPNPPSAFDAAERRDAALQRELDGVRQINRTIEGVIASLDRAHGSMQTVSRTVGDASALLNTWTRLLSQTEHNQRLLLDPRWKGASQDLLDAEAEAAQQREQEAARQRRRDEAKRRADEEDERRRLASASGSGTAATGSGRGRPAATSGRAGGSRFGGTAPRGGTATATRSRYTVSGTTRTSTIRGRGVGRGTTGTGTTSTSTTGSYGRGSSSGMAPADSRIGRGFGVPRGTRAGGRGVR